MRLIATATVLGLASVSAAAAGGGSAARFTFNPLGTYSTFLFDEGGCEIVSYDPSNQRLYVVNGGEERIDVLDTGAEGSLAFAFSIDISSYGPSIQSVAVKNGMVAAAIGAAVETDPGTVAIFDLDGNPLHAFTTGVLPDMVGFSPDGRYVVTADEGQPNDDYTIDPPGGVTIVDLQAKGGPSAMVVTFESIDPAVIGEGIVLSSPEGTTFAQAMEPEYVAFSSDSTYGLVSCQENNAFAKIDFATGTWAWARSMGFKDHSLPGNALDASNRDERINIATWPISGIFMPDSVAMFTVGGVDYVATANEGDGRDYAGYSNEERVKDLVLDPTAFPDAATLQENENLGRIKVDASLGDVDGDGDYDALYSFGARSMAVFDVEGNLVADTGKMMEQITATLLPADFNSTNDENDSFDNRSDDKGPEPEGIAIGEIDGRTIAFVCLERIGGIMAFDVSVPTAPAYAGYVNTRDFSGDPLEFTAGDLGPEGIAFIAAADSSTGRPMIAVGFEISGTARLIEVLPACEGDINSDGVTDSVDLGVLLASWGACTETPCLADLDGDGTVGADDLGVLIANWGSCGSGG